jgi:hypothetical protein
MVGLPLKQQYGPSLGQLLAPRWRRLSRSVQILLAVLGVGLLAALVGIALRIRDAVYSRGAPVPFSFEYKGLYKAPVIDGGYVKVVRLKDGELEDSFEVAPLRLPAYQGSITAFMPLYAAGYTRMLRARYGRGFLSDGEGKTRINAVPGYDIFFSAVIDGRTMFGRDVLITPERPGVREGVIIEMLTYSKANRGVRSPTLVAGEGVLKRPLETFTFE